MMKNVEKDEIFGFIRPGIDVHTLGINTVAKMIEECGFRVIICDSVLADAITNISKLDNISFLSNWIISNKITRLGFSYRLDPQDAQICFGKVYSQLRDNKHFCEQGGTINQIYFSGLPEACYRIESEYDKQIPFFIGGETQIETLRKLGIPEVFITPTITEGSKYDDERIMFAQNIIKSGEYKYLMPNDRFKYQNFGTEKDTLVERVSNNKKKGFPPLMRVHVG
ncbi:MAG: cobalamin-binding protein, partial [Bacteroidetes bacterium]|nr:cobalamin-binding protein [Bacteroidota bacterium]